MDCSSPIESLVRTPYIELPRSFQSENGDSIVQIVVFERFDFSGKFPEETLFILREQK